jgi:Protein of unknown function (DUF2628)
MKVYTTHCLPNAPREDALFIKDGFSWPAFLFPAIWFIIKRLWLALALYILAVAVISATASATDLSGGSIFVILLGLNLILGFEANKLNRRALARRGFAEEGPFVGEDLEEVELKYFQSQLAVQDSPTTTPSLKMAAIPGPGSA